MTPSLSQLVGSSHWHAVEARRLIALVACEDNEPRLRRTLVQLRHAITGQTIARMLIALGDSGGESIDVARCRSISQEIESLTCRTPPSNASDDEKLRWLADLQSDEPQRRRLRTQLEMLLVGVATMEGSP